MTIKRDTFVGTVVVLLALLLVVQVGIAFARWRGASVATVDDFAAVIGKTLRTQVAVANGGTHGALSSYSARSCRYVIITTPTCSAAANSFRQWRQDLAGDPHPFPDGWAALWVTTGDSTSGRSFLSDAFPVERLFYSAGPGLITELSLNAFPAHVILNWEGRIVEGGVGARLPPKRAFRPDCTIVDDTSPSASRER